MSMSVCVSVSPQVYLQNYTIILNKFLLIFTYGCGSVLLWLRCDVMHVLVIVWMIT